MRGTVRSLPRGSGRYRQLMPGDTSSTRPAESRAEVVIVGGGVAALEALIALHDLAARRVHVTLIAPEREFVYRPLAVSEPFGLGARTRRALAHVARDFDADLVSDAVVEIETAAALVRCRSGREWSYDSLIVAPGARREPAFEHAVVVGDESEYETLHGILADLEAGYVKRLAFVAPSEVVWSLPLYELALLTAEDAWSMGIDDARLVVISAEERPLHLFGPAAGEQLEDLLARRGIEFIGGSRPQVRRGEVVVRDRHIGVDRTFALPLLGGPGLAGLPADAQGFIPVDRHGRVKGLDDVFAAGDATTFPLKQGGIAAQQAEAAAAAVAARHGCAIEPAPFRPVLRGKLLTRGGDLYLESQIAGGAGEGSAASRPLWWPPAKIAARRLGPYLLGADEAERVQSTSATEIPAV
jgi:sulfide:quinone oxidoreductase